LQPRLVLTVPALVLRRVGISPRARGRLRRSESSASAVPARITVGVVPASLPIRITDRADAHDVLGRRTGLPGGATAVVEISGALAAEGLLPEAEARSLERAYAHARVKYGRASDVPHLFTR